MVLHTPARIILGEDAGKSLLQLLTLKLLIKGYLSAGIGIGFTLPQSAPL
jgi:hypothetical protein